MDADIAWDDSNIEWDQPQQQPQQKLNPFMRTLGEMRPAPFGPPLKDYIPTAIQAGNLMTGGLLDYDYEGFTGKHLPQPESLSGKLLSGVGLFGGIPAAAGKVAKLGFLGVAPKIAESLLGRAALRGTEAAAVGAASTIGQPKEMLPRAAGFGAFGAAASPVVDVATGQANLFGKFYKPGQANLNPFAVGPTEVPVHLSNADVARMSPQNRASFFASQKGQIGTQEEAQLGQLREGGRQLERGLNERSLQLENRRVELQKSLTERAHGKVVQARPEIARTMSEASDEYRRLIQLSLEGADEVPVTAGEISDQLNRTFGGDVNAHARALQKLGISNSGEGWELKTVTPRTLKNRLASSRSGTPFQARAGKKLYTPDNMHTDDVVSSVSDILEQHGVDLSPAREFWSRWAPIRNQAFRQFNPFQTVPTETATGARTLISAAKGSDPGNVNFIKELEKRIGLNLTDDLKSIVSQMDATQKSKLAIQAERELGKTALSSQESAIKQSSELKRSGVSAEEQNVQSRAESIDRVKRIRDWIIAAVGGGALFKAGEKLLK